MIRNLIKLGVLSVVAVCSWQVSSHYINDIVLEVESKEDTITDIIIKQQVEETLKEAEEKIEEVVKEENIIIEQEEVAIKPAEPPKEEKVEEVIPEVAEGEDQVETIPESEEIPEVPENDTDGAGLLGITTLTKDEATYLANYLIDNYFLFGERYYIVETDPVRYERKKLANDMEAHIIQSIAEVQSLMTEIFSLSSQDLKPVLEDTHSIAKTFVDTYSTVGEQGPEFQAIYDECIKYFEAYSRGLTHAINTFETLETTTNKALVLPIMLKSINQDILPAIKDVLNQGFAVKEKTNLIYIEGIDGSFLLTPEEVMAILENPRSILPQQESTLPTDTPTQEPEGGPQPEGGGDTETEPQEGMIPEHPAEDKEILEDEEGSLETSPDTPETLPEEESEVSEPTEEDDENTAEQETESIQP